MMNDTIPNIIKGVLIALFISLSITCVIGFLVNYEAYDKFTCNDFTIHTAHIDDPLFGEQTYYVIEIHDGPGKNKTIEYNKRIKISNENKLTYEYRSDKNGNIEIGPGCDITIDIATARTAHIID